MKNQISTICALLILFAVGFTTYAQHKDISLDEVPNQITEYLKTYFPDSAVVKTLFDDHEIFKKYELYLKNEFSLEFKLQGIKSKARLTDAMVPKEILRYVANDYPKKKTKTGNLKAETSK